MVRENEIASQRKFSLGLCHCLHIEPGEGGGQEAGGRIEHSCRMSDFPVIKERKGNII